RIEARRNRENHPRNRRLPTLKHAFPCKIEYSPTFSKSRRVNAFRVLHRRLRSVSGVTRGATGILHPGGMAEIIIIIGGEGEPGRFSDCV
ncbi:MAG: hypothetical protein KGJ78_17545, partial [Alphaproteobacteria bacterium]|nr:hypothetical protein [Alphaproteobacteria bacterium]